jgi:hypothetical protein
MALETAVGAGRVKAALEKATAAHLNDAVVARTVAKDI